MLELLSSARRAAAECAAAPVWAVPDQDLAACLIHAWAGVQQLTATLAHLIFEAQGRGMPQAQGATSTTVWLRHLLRVNPGTAGWLVHLAEALDTRPALDAAVCAGTVSAEHATTVAAIVTNLPSDLGLEIIEQAEATLLGWVDDCDPITLAKAGTRILDHVAPEIAEKRDADWIARQDKKAYRKRGFTMSPLGNGQVHLSGWLDAAGAAIVNAALDPLCHPRHDDPAGPRTPAQRRADALVDICAAALRDGVPGQGGDAAQVVVTVPFSTLAERLATVHRPAQAKRPASTCRPTSDNRPASADGPASPDGPASLDGSGSPDGPASPDGSGLADGSDGIDRPASGVRPVPGTAGPDTGDGLGVGWLDTGAPISAAEARRMACDALIVPAVLGGDSQPLDLGRARRLFTGPIRRALILRDVGCSFPSCDRPARWSEGHHLRGWADGGTTDLANACLVCRHHHRLLHDDSGWQVRLGADGHPEYLPPPTIDPQQHWRRNIYHRRQ